MLATPQEYLDTLSGPGKEWLAEFLNYMSNAHPDIPPVMFRQRPMFKIGKSYVFFTVAQQHFSVHTLNFELIEALKARLPKADYGKGCVKVKFSDASSKPVLRALCDEVIRVNHLPDAPQEDAMPKLSYEEQFTKAFSGGKAKWLPLYISLRDRARMRLPEFREYFPAINALWKHDSTFAQVSAVAGAMRVEFYADCPCPERNPIKVQQLSKNRVAHVVEVTDESMWDELLGWIEGSYMLTRK